MELKRALAESFLSSHPDQAARTLETMEPAASAVILCGIEPKPAWRVICAMVPSYAVEVFKALAKENSSEHLTSAPLRAAAVLLRRIPASERETSLSRFPTDVQRRLRLLLRQRQRTAGELADPDVLVLRETLSVADTKKMHQGRLIEATYAVPVVDEDHRFLGTVRLEDLSAAKKASPIGGLVREGSVVLGARAAAGAVAAHPAWRDHASLPVVDGDGVFIGLLHHETLRDLQSGVPGDRRQTATTTADALGDLFRAGMGGMFEAFVQSGKARHG